MEGVGPDPYTLFIPNSLKLPLHTYAIPHFVAHIFQKGF